MSPDETSRYREDWPEVSRVAARLSPIGITIYRF